jgi:hypothetical protein
VPSVWERLRDSPAMPAFVATVLTFLILVLLKPQFVLRKHSSKIALPCINYSIVFWLCVAVFCTVLFLPPLL